MLVFGCVLALFPLVFVLLAKRNALFIFWGVISRPFLGFLWGHPSVSLCSSCWICWGSLGTPSWVPPGPIFVNPVASDAPALGSPWEFSMMQLELPSPDWWRALGDRGP